MLHLFYLAASQGINFHILEAIRSMELEQVTKGTGYDQFTLHPSQGRR